jgi:HlyD family secretion protein
MELDMRRKSVVSIIAAVVLAAGLTAFGYQSGANWLMALSGGKQPDPNLAESAGRLEAQEIDVASKYAGRLVSIPIEEGDAVKKGDVIAQLDRTDIEAMLRTAEAQILRAREGLAEAAAAIAQRKSEVEFTDAELLRAVRLRDREVVSGAVYEQKKANHDSAAAGLLYAVAAKRTAEANVKVAIAERDRLTIQLKESDIVSPGDGRVLYKLAQPGEVIGAGQRLATVLDLSDVYLTVFLPMEQASRVTIGQEASVTLDAMPEEAMTARVDFISPRAQFTPKTVETRDERAKFVFRVKVRITDSRGLPLNPGIPAVARIPLVAAISSAEP